MTWTQDSARDLAVEALGFIAADPEMVQALLANAGLRPEDLRHLATSPDLGQFVLDFILEDDRRVLDFAASTGIRPEAVMAARTVLAGPGSAGWSAD
ncbi:MAG: DUF3572 domain-containing protein [Paracoccus sp. (in: a-proteobacteria)]|uniref:DUF3572 domain-containing protein n=1 Tax=Paracoccus sp. TaxID=267 RepID=UPI0026DEFA31|nr:DUF3572 domain-containing protein [Paracoccus sp. (in: a-proteobacteria)]MDO5630474.1 DUF3572 domain-containing protein [Paracoccus sp. (in: a-proteobacteria)]